MPEPTRTVLVTDFLAESSVESAVLDGVARVVCAGARDESELSDLVAEADAFMVFHDVSRISDVTLSRAPRCLGIVRAGVGYNNVDLDAAAARGIVVCNVPDYGTEEVADHAIMLMLAVARFLVPCHDAIRAGAWDYHVAAATPRLRGKTLGLVGCGRIGTATALRAKAFGLDVAFYDPFAVPGLDKALGIRRVPTLDDLLRQSQVLSLHCYLDETTRHLIDAEALAKLPEGAIVVNTARGPILDQDALLEALDSGRLLGAGLDVLEREPLDNERLRKHPKVIFTPHSAFYSVEGFEELRRKTAEEARRFLLGEPPRCPVNLDRIAPGRRRLPAS
jgi:phosphoglycerate dehydrogenase-like enzyme